MHITRRAMLGAGAAGVALLAGCATGSESAAPQAAAAGDAGTQFSALLDQFATDILRTQPQRASALGVSEERAGGRFVDRMTDNAKEANRRYRTLLENALGQLERLDKSALAPRDQVSYDVVATSFRNSVGSLSYEVGSGATEPYVVTQLTGAYTGTPDFLDNQHPLTNRDQVDAYFARLRGFVTQLDVDTHDIPIDAAAGYTPPDFAIDRALQQLNVFTSAAPAETVLVTTLVRRLPNVAELSEQERAAYIARAETMVRDEVLPAYQRQIAALQAIRASATHDAGIWRLPHGEEMYAVALRNRTTTEMSPDDIHNTGVELIQSLHGEMDQILRQQGLTSGTVAERVRALSTRADQLYPNNDEGRAQILADLNARTQDIIARMPRVCGVLAHAPLEIRRVPVFTEAGAPGGYYQRASIDGARPGAYFINLRDTAEWPRFTLPTLNYHEGVPGHHWQGSIQQESGGLPFIRSALLGNSAFGEGWGLYAEQLAHELGVYDNDPLGYVGYLQSMAFRASRLVVDTGIHTKRWTREQAIQSMQEATGDDPSSITTEIERYCVRPGQACSYMVGKLTILRAREDARTAMGGRFDIKGFHDLVLANGSVPLSVLEQNVRAWAATA